MKAYFGFMTLAASIALSGCGVAEAVDGTVVTSSPPPAREPVADRNARASSFSQWQNEFRVRAISEGIQPALVDQAITGLTPSQRVQDLDGDQPEFVRPIWDYLDRAVSDARISSGRSKSSEWGNTLAAIEARYNVDRRVVLAIWGLETGYGSVRGSFSALQSLATLAYDGRRREFAERELIAALNIVQSGDIELSGLVGSWAGAMGHTQFMPTSYLAFAQDFDGDGRRHIWGEDPTDALASAAYYLQQNGWISGQPWGVEVQLPADFNWILVDRNVERPTGFWSNAGLRTINGGSLPDHGPAALLAPMGVGGPVFMIYNNFRVIKTYNNSDAYALAIGLIGDQIYGGQGVQAAWPTDILPITRSDRRELQQRLTAMGYDTQGADGLIGPNSEAAIRAFQVDRGIIPDGVATDKLLARVREG